MTLEPIMIGMNLNGTKMTVDSDFWVNSMFFDKGIPYSKVIAETDTGCQIIEQSRNYSPGSSGTPRTNKQDRIYISYTENGVAQEKTIASHYYNTVGITYDGAYVYIFDNAICPETFGTITEIDETSICYPYVLAVDDKPYLHKKNHERVEGVSREEFDALVARVDALENA